MQSIQILKCRTRHLRLTSSMEYGVIGPLSVSYISDLPALEKKIIKFWPPQDTHGAPWVS